MTDPDSRRPDRRALLGAVGVIVAIVVFAVTVTISLRTPGTIYDWWVNMISDLGDSACGVRDERQICSPGHLAFNAGLIATGVLLAAAALCEARLWGRGLAGSVVVMGTGLVVAGAFPAGSGGGLHLVGVVLGLVVPGYGLLLSSLRPATAWLRSRRRTRGLLAAIALVSSALSGVPGHLLPRGATEVAIVGALLVALLAEGISILAANGGRPALSRSGGGTGATTPANR